MSSLLDREPSTRIAFDSLKRPLERAADSPPDEDAMDDGDFALVAWIQQLIQLIVGLFVSALTPIAERLTELEQDLYARQRQTIDATAPTNVPPAGQGTSSGAPQPTSSSKPSSSRCGSCHVKGHSTDQCQTADPATMRKRVARNNRIAKERRRQVTQQVPFPILPPTPFPQAASSASTTNSMDYARLSADATEFRRRQAQSIKDKRHAKRSPRS